jgi:hypothetical protein
MENSKGKPLIGAFPYFPITHRDGKEKPPPLSGWRFSE